jgi:CheY-like chemotaxis protein
MAPVTVGTADAVFQFLRPRRRRQMSPEERARLVAMGHRHRFHGARSVETDPESTQAQNDKRQAHPRPEVRSADAEVVSNQQQRPCSPVSVVLVVDDNADTNEALVTLLGTHGFDATGAASGLLALDYFDAGGRPCVVLLDVRMPDMDGWELWERMKAHDELARTAVVLLSADTADASRSTAIAGRDPDWSRRRLASSPPRRLTAASCRFAVVKTSPSRGESHAYVSS